MDKKKYLGTKMGVLLLFLLLNLFVFCTTSFANDTEEMTFEDADYLFNYAMTTTITTSENLATCYNFSPKCVETTYTESGTQTTSKSQVNSVFNNDTAKNNFVTAFNQANAGFNLKLSIKNYMFIFYTNNSYTASWNTSSYLYVLCIPVNNTSSDTLPYPVIYYNRYPESSYGIGQMTLDFVTQNSDEDLTMRVLTSDERNNLSQKPFIITIKRDLTCTYALNNWNARKMRVITNKSYRAILYNYGSSGTLKYSPLNIIFPINQASNVLYTTTNTDILSNTTSFNSSTFSPFLIKSWGRTIQTQEVPDDEDNTGDTGESGTTGGSGNTGNITNPSGESTGKVDLSGIENGIGNINQNLDKTNEKLDGISGEIGNLNNSVNDLNNFLSGEIKTETGEIERSINN